MKALLNSRGQVAVEAVLMLAVLVGFSTYVTQYIRNQNVISQWVEGPWTYIDGMAQNGVWGPNNKTKRFHPNIGRRVSTEPENE